MIYRVSVRNFVEFLLRSGDIDNRRGAVNTADAMQEGSRIHRKIQGSKDSGYRAEVSLKQSFCEEEYEFVLEGRADGIFKEEESGIWAIDEIKGVYLDLEDLEEPVAVHLAQAKCYAYLYSLQENLDEMLVQMTYCNMELFEEKDTSKKKDATGNKQSIKYFINHYSKEELESWFCQLYDEYKKWLQYRMEARKVRQASIHQLEFPYPYRPGQKELVSNVYISLKRGKTLFVQAPTGVGKTISTIFPAVKAVGEELGDIIFYLTAKTITRKAAEDAFSLLVAEGLQEKIITITAKDKVCQLEERSCNPVDCPYAKGYYDRINDAVYEYLTTRMENGVSNREKLTEYALEKNLCPFEFSLDLALWVDAIICDYNYVFDPNVYLKRFFAEGIKGDYFFLVDEAHNLIERGREMYSATLVKEDFLAMRRMFKPMSKRVSNAMESCNKLLLEYKRQCDGYQVLTSYSPFIFACMRLMGELERFFKDHPTFDGGEAFSQFYLDLRHFLNMCDILDEAYEVYTEHDEEGRFCIHLYCIDTSKVLQNRINMAKATVFFSATLLPIHYYKQMLCDEADPYAVYANTSFTREQSKILVATDVSSKYTRRTPEEFNRIASYIYTCILAKPGNYMVFFPSYAFLKQVQEQLQELLKNQDVFLCKDEENEDAPYNLQILEQNSFMKEEERENFLAFFEDDSNGSTVLGMCVMGGIFSEGIDLRGKSLIGTIIVGTGLPQVSNQRKVLQDYFDERRRSGFDLSYRFPGMSKVQQAAGRVIRTKEDRGVILLLDERFLQRDNLSLFPREWSHYETVTLDTLPNALAAFWKEAEP